MIPPRKPRTILLRFGSSRDTRSTLHGAVLLALAAAACGSTNSAQHTVPGPEAEDLLPRAHGTVVLTAPVGGIATVRLPDLARAFSRPPDAGLVPVHSVAGPEAQGRIAFVADDMLNERYELLRVPIDGGDPERVFAADGDVLWQHAVGEFLAVDPAGARVALVARNAGVQLHGPDVLLFEGELEIWDVAARARVAARTGVLDDGLAWFPDGRQLAFTALVPRAEAERLRAKHVTAGDAFGRGMSGWERVPAVHVLDLESGAAHVVHVGERPVVAPDGRSLVLVDSEGRWRLFDLEHDVSRALRPPGATNSGPIAFVAPGLVLFWALPTEGAALRETEHNSPFIGPKPMCALKLLDLADGRFQTVVPDVDPRHSVSFGAWPAGGN